MKKVILILLSFLAICSMSSCAEKSGSLESNTENIEELDGDLPSDFNKKTSQVDAFQTDSYKEDNVFQFFSLAIQENPYDQWLKEELEKGERAEKTIYAEYLAFWKDEFVYTIESCEMIFDNNEQYEQWKSNMQQWLVTSQEILKTEMDVMNVSLGQLEVIIPYCEMVRQKTIDMKHFLYYYQVYNTLTPYTDIEITWCFK